MTTGIHPGSFGQSSTIDPEVHTRAKDGLTDAMARAETAELTEAQVLYVAAKTLRDLSEELQRQEFDDVELEELREDLVEEAEHIAKQVRLRIKASLENSLSSDRRLRSVFRRRR